MIKILSIIGTRPEAIKMAPVIKEFQNYPDQVQSELCLTAQHRELVDQVLKLFAITPDYDLNLMRINQTLPQLTSKILTKMTPIFEEVNPDWILVQGDTTTVMTASLLAYYLKIRVGHIEAGLRTYNKWHPYPEEINRRISDVIADLHFVPTQRAKQNLLNEGIDSESIHITGNTVIDALHHVVQLPSNPKSPIPHIDDSKRLFLLTAHRRENFGEPLANICQAILELVQSHPDIQFVYPVHPNPHVQGVVNELLGNHPSITLTPPLDYLTMTHLIKRSYLILTDSGGLQEEAPSLGKPVLVLRQKTERPEGVEAGCVKVVGTDKKSIIQHVEILLNNSSIYQTMAQAVNPYGDGTASKKIVEILLQSKLNQ